MASLGMRKTLSLHIRNTLPFLRPIWGIVVGFGVTGYLIYKIPISEEAKAKSKFLHPE